jgi:hypothetical protein
VITLLPFSIFDFAGYASTRMSSIARFNKPSRILVEQQYTLTINFLDAEDSHEDVD